MGDEQNKVRVLEPLVEGGGWCPCVGVNKIIERR